MKKINLVFLIIIISNYSCVIKNKIIYHAPLKVTLREFNDMVDDRNEKMKKSYEVNTVKKALDLVCIYQTIRFDSTLKEDRYSLFISLFDGKYSNECNQIIRAAHSKGGVLHSKNDIYKSRHIYHWNQYHIKKPR